MSDGRMVRGAMFSGGSPVKFVSGPPAQVNINQVNGVDDWRPVPDTTLTLADVPSITELPPDVDYQLP